MNDRLLVGCLLKRTLARAEFLILLVAAAAVAFAAGIGSQSPGIRTDPVMLQLVAGVPRIFFAAFVILSPVLLIQLADADRRSGWTAPLFAARGSPIVYVFALIVSVAGAGAAALAGISVAFHGAAGTLDFGILANVITGTLSLTVLSCYAAVLWILLYHPTRAFLVLLLLLFGPLGMAFYLVVVKGAAEPPLWLRVLLGLVPPVRQSADFTPALIQSAYIAITSGLLLALSPQRVPVWR